MLGNQITTIGYSAQKETTVLTVMRAQSSPWERSAGESERQWPTWQRHNRQLSRNRRPLEVAGSMMEHRTGRLRFGLATHRTRSRRLVAALLPLALLSAGCSPGNTPKLGPTITTVVPTTTTSSSMVSSQSTSTTVITASSPLTVRSTDEVSRDSFEVLPSSLSVAERFTSIIAGPFEVHTATGTEPTKPVRLTFQYDPAKVPNPGTLRVVHHNASLNDWLVETTAVDVNAHTATAVLASLSGVALADVVGTLTGNRAGSGPTGCSGTTPDWITGTTATNHSNDALRSCIVPAGDNVVVVHLLNNRGYAMTFEASAGVPGITQDVSFPSSLAAALVGLISRRRSSPQRLVLLPGEEAALTYERPTSGDVNVHLAAEHGWIDWVISAMFQGLGQAASAFPSSNATADFANLRLNGTDCALSLDALAVSPTESTAIGALRTCVPVVVDALKPTITQMFVESFVEQHGVQEAEKLGEAAAKKFFEQFAEVVVAQAVVGVGQSAIDALAEQYPVPESSFTLIHTGARGTPQQTIFPSSGMRIPTSAWKKLGQAELSPGTDGAFTIESTQQYWGGFVAHTNECNYRLSGQARVLSGNGLGFNVRTKVVSDNVLEGHGFQYDPGADGIRDITYPDVESSPTAIQPTNTNWHSITVDVDGDRYRTTLDGQLEFTGTTTATCGDVFLRVWSGKAEFRDMSLEPSMLSTTPVDGPPTIASVSTITHDAEQEITITGRGFGHYDTPTVLPVPCIALSDVTSNWRAGHVDVAGKPAGAHGACSAPRSVVADVITFTVARWSDNRIVLERLSGQYGNLQRNWVLREGDTIDITVANAQTGLGPASYRTTVSTFGAQPLGGPPSAGAASQTTSLPASEWHTIGDTKYVAGDTINSFRLSTTATFWAGATASTHGLCDYRFEGDARVVTGDGYGFYVRSTSDQQNRPLTGKGFQYVPQIPNVSDIELPQSETGSAKFKAPDHGWHSVVVEVSGTHYKSFFDGELQFEGTTTASCGDVYLRVWRTDAEFRNLTIRAADPSPDSKQATSTGPFNNGGFEQPNLNGKCIVTLAAGQTIGPWTVGLAGVDHMGSGSSFSAPNQSIDLSALDAGSISQTFDTIAGTTYSVQIDAAANVVGPPAAKTFTVSVDSAGAQPGSYSATKRGGAWCETSAANSDYDRYEYRFAASAATTTLVIASTTAGRFGPVIDNVTVTSVSVK